MKNDWFKNWFESDYYLQIYSHRNLSDANKLINLIFNNINLAQGANVLDAACGPGRHSLILSKKNLNVYGFDLSLNLLKIAKSSLSSENIQFRLFRSDIRKVCLKKLFDAVFLLFTSFGYFESDDENFLFPRKSYLLLKSNGYFIIDYFNESFVKNNLVPKSIKKINGNAISEERTLIDNTVVKKIEIMNGNRKKVFFEKVKLYDKNFIIEKFENIGFSAYKIFGNYEGDSFNKNESERLIIIFKK